MADSSVNILIVDDRADKLLALEAVLDDLGQNLVTAEGGRDALRQVLKHEFAVILLDVNMPGMDGFETAQLIRQRRNCADVPIIFLTAMGDEMDKARSYSLGAVDYILTPVVPQILRSKVAVFVELFKKTQQVSLQAERLRQRAAQLHQLTTASIAINSAASIDKIVEITTNTAREIIDAHQAVTLVNVGAYPVQPGIYASYSPKYAQWQNSPHKIDNPALLGLLQNTAKPLRMVQSELETQFPLGNGNGRHGPPLHGLLAVPFAGRAGRHLGTILLSDKIGGEFTDDDQAILIQLAQMASVAIENTIFAAEREDNRLKEEFLSTLSHELRTPLNAMSGWIQLLRREPVNGDIAHGLGVIERNVHAQTQLIEDLLDLSRISSKKLRLNPRPVLLRPLVENAVDALRPVIMERQIALSCQTEDINPTVVGDPDRLQQVFSNLLSNAAKFTPAGGTITIALRNSGGLLKISVEDTGQGIDREFLPHVFDRFRQADGAINRRHGGLGIGLTIVRHLVELHGGTVMAESAGQGRGSTFTVTIPEAAVEQEHLTRSPDYATLPVPSLEGLTILVVDDHPDAREVVSEILRRQEAKVVTAASAREALQLLSSVKPDVLLTDLGMPDENGFCLLRQMRDLSAGQGGNIPAIALTAFASAEDRHQALQAGFQAHLSKPVNPRDLIETIHRFARPSAPASAGVAVDEMPAAAHS